MGAWRTFCANKLISLCSHSAGLQEMSRPAASLGGFWKPLLPRQLRPPLEVCGPSQAPVCLTSAGCLDFGHSFLLSFPAGVGGGMEQENSRVSHGGASSSTCLLPFLAPCSNCCLTHQASVSWPPTASLEPPLVTLSSLQSSLLDGPEHSNPALLQGLCTCYFLCWEGCLQISARLLPSPPPLFTQMLPFQQGLG